MNILVIGDIVGKGGRLAVVKHVQEMKREWQCGFCIANGENIAGGAGMTLACAEELKTAGVDVITTGDHIWDQKEFVQDIHRCGYVLRPANFNAIQPGKGFGLYNIPIGGMIGVVNLIGNVFMKKHSDNPFVAADRIITELRQRTAIIFVDFHAEATSEKIAMGRYLDGRVTAVFGTHTHVQTADEEIFPGGTAYVSDLGMVGSKNSILGREIDSVIKAFATGMPGRFKVVEKEIVINGALVDIDVNSGRARKISRFSRDVSI